MKLGENGEERSLKSERSRCSSGGHNAAESSNVPPEDEVTSAPSHCAFGRRNRPKEVCQVMHVILNSHKIPNIYCIYIK